MIPTTRRESKQIMVGDVKVGGDAPVVVQSMCSTDAHRNAYGHVQWLREQMAATQYPHIKDELAAEADLIEEELWAAYALYVETVYPFDALPFDVWIQPPRS